MTRYQKIIILIIIFMNWNSTFAMKRTVPPSEPSAATPWKKELEKSRQKGTNALKNTDSKKFESFLEKLDALAQKIPVKNK